MNGYRFKCSGVSRTPSPGSDGSPTIVLERSNTEGELHALLMQYTLDGGIADHVVGAGGPSEMRFLRVRCQVRAVGADHTLLLRVVARQSEGGERLGRYRVRLTPEEWRDVDAYFSVEAARSCRIQLDDRSVTAAPSHVEIRGLVVAQRVVRAEVGSD